MKDQAVLRGDTWHYYLSGGEVSQEEYEKYYPPLTSDAGGFNTPSPAAWRNFYSDALAVHPKQVKKAEREAREKGVPTEFETEFGRPKFTSREHRRKYMRAFQFYDRNGGYSD